MEPRIQYAKTADGVSIVFYAMGEGMPLVSMPNPPFSHIQMEWQDPNWRGFYEALAARRKLINYDNRGSGLSAREVSDYSLDAHLLDLDAVTNRLNLQSFALHGYAHSAPIAMAYAARHPDRLSHLVIQSGHARASDYWSAPQIETLLALLDRDWNMFTEATAQVYFGWGTGEPARWFAQWLRECVTHEGAKAAIRELQGFDVASVLPQIRAQTLVLHQRQDPLSSADISREIASAIPDARLLVLEGPKLGGEEEVSRAIDEFLGEGEEARPGAEPPEAGAFRTVLFTDVEGSTSLTQRLGDAGARDVLRTHERIVRDALRSHGGSEVKTMGDGFMASFSSATRALECTIAMQRAFAEHNEEAAEPIRVRVGLNAGEPIAEEEDLFGTAVIVAARIAAKAEGGEVLASDVVRQLVAGKGFLFSDRGDVALRGFEDPVRLYEVRWRV
ncbi:MAG: alpha/beta fold hydrolase [Dehalococcoidia bacterium]